MQLYDEHGTNLEALVGALGRELPGTYFAYYFVSQLRERQILQSPPGQ